MYFCREKGCSCLVGHIMKRCGQGPKTYDFDDAEVSRHHDAFYQQLSLAERADFRSLMSWNDHPSRTIEHVIQLCDKVSAQP